MKQATVTVLYVMLATTASFASAFPFSWSEYYRNALYRNGAAKLQQQNQCPPQESPASIACQSARLTANGRNTYIHVCPERGTSPQEVCYNSKLPRCCPTDVTQGVLKCVSATKLVVAGQQVTVGIYEQGANQGHCTYFQSAVQVRSCCTAADQELPCETPVTAEPPTPPPCMPKRDVYFVLDATQSIGSEIFCRFGYTIQLIEAAINPGGVVDGARVSTVLFENDLKGADAGHLFDLNDLCPAAVSTNIPRIVYEYKAVETGSLTHEGGGLTYPQVGSTTTTPYSALALISDQIKRDSGTRPTSVIILTDGKPQQDISSIIAELKDTSAVLIAAGIGSQGDINEAVLREMVSDPANAVYEPDTAEAIRFAERIVERMKFTGALCVNQAERILASLERANQQNLNEYCSTCMFVESPSSNCRNNEFPQCGARNLQMQAFDESAKVENKDLQKLILEEKILEDMEKIMKMEEQRKQRQESVFLTAV